MKYLLTLLAVLILSGCQMLGGSQQETSGQTVWNIETDVTDKGEPYISNVNVQDGKEKSDVKVEYVPTEDGKVNKFVYEAESVKAFQGQALRADVDKSQAEAFVDSLEAVMPGVTEVFKTYLGL